MLEDTPEKGNKGRTLYRSSCCFAQDESYSICQHALCVIVNQEPVALHILVKICDLILNLLNFLINLNLHVSKL